MKFVGVLNELFSTPNTVPNQRNLRVAKTLRQRPISRSINEIYQKNILFGDMERDGDKWDGNSQHALEKRPCSNFNVKERVVGAQTKHLKPV